MSIKNNPIAVSFKNVDIIFGDRQDEALSPVR